MCPSDELDNSGLGKAQRNINLKAWLDMTAIKIPYFKSKQTEQNSLKSSCWVGAQTWAQDSGHLILGSFCYNVIPQNMKISEPFSLGFQRISCS